MWAGWNAAAVFQHASWVVVDREVHLRSENLEVMQELGDAAEVLASSRGCQ